MKINMPITDNERVMKEGDILVSTTDLKGTVTFVNRAFIEISGFTEAELIRKSHSIVRHPDMPPAAFKDLWDTLKKGRPWTGIIKNRVKNGDFYWVVANVIPIKKNGQVVEYMSVRTKPTRDEIKQAEITYQAMNAEKQPRKNPIKILMTAFSNTGLRIKLALFSLVIAGVLITGGIEEYKHMHKINQTWDNYKENTQKRYELINDFTALFGYGGMIHQFKDYELRQDEIYHDKFKQKFTTFNEKVGEYKNLSDLQPQESQHLSVLVNIANQYNTNANIIEVAFENGEHIVDIDKQFSVDDSSAINSLNQLKSGVKEQTSQVSNVLTEQIEASIFGIFVERIVSFIVIIGLLMVALSRSIIKPINDLIQVLNNINEGKYENKIDIRKNSEFGRLSQSLYVTQTKLNFDIQESRLTAEEALRIKNALDNVTANVMVADGQRNIIYMNESVRKTLKNAESEIRQDLPHFKSDQLMGNCIDVFEQRPLFQQQTLQELSCAQKSEITLGNRVMDITLNPVTNEANDRLGTVIEWYDKTGEVAIEREIDDIVAAAANGDLSKRIDVEGKNAFFTKLSLGLNELLESSSDFIDDIGGLFSRLAEGDLTHQIDKEYHGEFQAIKNDANNTVIKLTSIINQITTSSETVKTAAHEIALGNTDLSQRTEEQACSLEETASSMEEITATIKQSSDNTYEANQLANDAKDKAQNGGKTVQDAVSAMKDILTASHRINDIIAVIDEIAFQTNLLALNAAVEAARAGEQGRGFAVVAGEVRNLSQRSADAAKEIKDLIRDSVDKVNIGSSLVNNSGETLQDIVQSVEQVATMISEVSNAAKEQSSGMEQINQAVTQMDEVTQQNSSLVEQASVASSAMSDQVNHMVQLIQFFKIETSLDEEQYLEPVTSNAKQRKPRTANSQKVVAEKRTVEKKQRANHKAIAALSNDDGWESF